MNLKKKKKKKKKKKIEIANFDKNTKNAKSFSFLFFPSLLTSPVFLSNEYSFRFFPL